MKNIFGKIVGIVLTIAMLASCMSFATFADAAAAPFSGSGTEADPYLISTPQDLVTLEGLTNVKSTDDNAKYAAAYYMLTQDINMKDVTFNGLCKSEDASGNWSASVGFSGTIDGDGHIIENMTIARTTTGTNKANIFGALISRANGCTVKKLGLVNASVSAYQTAAGFIGGRFGSAVTLEDCFIKTITISTEVEGALNSRKQSAPFIACAVAGSTIRNCYSLDVNGASEGCAMGDYSSSSYKQSTAENCYSTNRFFSGRGITHTNGLQSIDSATEEEISAFITASNGAFEADTFGQNSGYPVLAWENDFLSGGSGTESDPFLLSTADDLVELSELTNLNTDAYNTFDSAYYKLTNDIDMTGVQNFYGICPRRGDSAAYSNTGSFSGTIDGNYHTISNITINACNVNGYAGLVAYTSAAATIKNLVVNTVTFN